MSFSTFFGSDPWIEGAVLDQADLVKSWPGVRDIALFPDAHPGKYGPVGMAMKSDLIFPLLVGNDIGCGIAVFTLNKPMRKLNIDKIVRAWADLHTPFEDAETWLEEQGHSLSSSLGLGTIGLGNHFCELQEVTKCFPGSPLKRGDAVLMVHSGSRGLGQRTFEKITYTVKGVDPLSDVAQEYMVQHNACLDFSVVNRSAVAWRASRALGLRCELLCDVPHNLIEKSESGWVHRKGAARAGGLVPVAGTRESPSWLVSSKGVEGSLMSLPHGAGRKIDRASCHGRFRAPRREKDGSVRSELGARLICSEKSLLIEETMRAYKDTHKIAQTIEEEGLGDILTELSPRITFKIGKTQ
jgi:release factor H-coupled RctB family protein